MNRLNELQSALDSLKMERVQVTQSWYLQNCWVTQSKPGGTARTNQRYWQARSREPIFGGKTMKHLRDDEVEDYKAAIARGRRLKQIDRQLAMLQQQLAQLDAPINSSLTEQERLVEEVLATSQELRASLHQAIAVSKQIAAKNLTLRMGYLSLLGF